MLRGQRRKEMSLHKIFSSYVVVLHTLQNVGWNLGEDVSPLEKIKPNKSSFFICNFVANEHLST